MQRRRLFNIMSAALVGAAIGIPVATTAAQETTPPTSWPLPGCPAIGPGQHLQGSGPRGMWAGPGPRAAAGFDMGGHFIEEMIPHHQDAIDMAELALVRAEHQEIRDLAASIKQTQTAEIEQMRQWYQEWYGTEPGPSRMAQMPNMPGHDLSAFEGAASFDKVFIEQMVPHHQMAVMMTSHMGGAVQQPELKALMEAMGASQAAEIQQMTGWYESWYGGALPAGASGPMGPGMGPGRGMGPGMRGPGMGMGFGPGPGMGPMWNGGRPPCLTSPGTP